VNRDLISRRQKQGQKEFHLTLVGELSDACLTAQMIEGGLQNSISRLYNSSQKCLPPLSLGLGLGLGFDITIQLLVPLIIHYRRIKAPTLVESAEDRSTLPFSTAFVGYLQAEKGGHSVGECVYF
jgi:hypothetical protein